MSSFTSIINPKSCSYYCGLQIYGNTSENPYFEVFTKKKHVYPNCSVSPCSIMIKSTNLECIAGYCLFISFYLRAKTKF